MILKRFLGISLILASCNNTSGIEDFKSKPLKEPKIEAKNPPSKEEHLPKKEETKTEIREEKKEENRPSSPKSSQSSVDKNTKKKSKKKHAKPSPKKKKEILNKLQSVEKDIDALEDCLDKL